MAKEIKLITINLTKINASKNPNFHGKLELTSNLHIKEIEKHKINETKQEILKITFGFDIVYKELGNVSIEGILFLEVEGRLLKDILNQWKQRNLSKEIHMLIVNIILKKATLKALQIEEELGLPPHFSLPRLNLNDEKDSTNSK